MCTTQQDSFIASLGRGGGTAEGTIIKEQNPWTCYGKQLVLTAREFLLKAE